MKKQTTYTVYATRNNGGLINYKSGLTLADARSLQREWVYEDTKENNSCRERVINTGDNTVVRTTDARWEKERKTFNE